MCDFCCCPANFVHATGTSGYHDPEKKVHSTEHGTDDRNQCGESYGETKMLKKFPGAHVIAYPCGNCCCGCLTINTTCHKCNDSDNTPKKPSFLGKWHCCAGNKFGCCGPCNCGPCWYNPCCAKKDTQWGCIECFCWPCGNGEPAYMSMLHKGLSGSIELQRI